MTRTNHKQPRTTNALPRTRFLLVVICSDLRHFTTLLMISAVLTRLTRDQIDAR